MLHISIWSAKTDLPHVQCRTQPVNNKNKNEIKKKYDYDICVYWMLSVGRPADFVYRMGMLNALIRQSHNGDFALGSSVLVRAK